jgi:hypothetical protein
MASGRAGNGAGNERASGQKAGAPDGLFPDESGLAEQAMWDNRLRGKEQRRGHNQRGSLAGEHTRTEGVVESFERMDPKNRA